MCESTQLCHGLLHQHCSSAAPTAVGLDIELLAWGLCTNLRPFRVGDRVHGLTHVRDLGLQGLWGALQIVEYSFPIITSTPRAMCLQPNPMQCCGRAASCTGITELTHPSNGTHWETPSLGTDFTAFGQFLIPRVEPNRGGCRSSKQRRVQMSPVVPSVHFDTAFNAFSEQS